MLKTSFEASRDTSANPKLATNSSKKASEDFRGRTPRVRVGHWGLTKDEQLPKLEQPKTEQ